MHPIKPNISDHPISARAENQGEGADTPKIRGRSFGRSKKALVRVSDAFQNAVSRLWHTRPPAPTALLQGLQTPGPLRANTAVSVSREPTPRSLPRTSFTGSETTDTSPIDWSGTNSPMHLYAAEQAHPPSLLMQAVLNSDRRMVSRFAPFSDANARFALNDCPPALGATPLMAAAMMRDGQIVMDVLRSNPEVNAAHDVMRFTPLMYAVEDGDLESVKVLVEAGADPYIKSAFGFTSLDMARQRVSRTQRGRDIVAYLEAYTAQRGGTPS